MLMATKLVNVKGQTLWVRINIPQLVTKTVCHRWLRRRPLYLCQIGANPYTKLLCKWI